MATAQEKQDLAKLKEGFSELKTDVAVMRNDMSYVKATAEKMDTFIEANKRGITFATLFDSRATTWFIGAVIAVVVWVAAKGGL